jgi:hypothetical protein
MNKNRSQRYLKAPEDRRTPKALREPSLYAYFGL